MAISDFEPECKIRLTFRDGAIVDLEGEYKRLPECLEIGMPGLKIKYFPWDILRRVDVQLKN